jgi:hypothetical protein
MASIAKVNPTLTGNVFSTLLMSSTAHSTPSLFGRLTFPSIYVGVLSIESLTPIKNIESLTSVNQIETLTPINQIGLY